MPRNSLSSRQSTAFFLVQLPSGVGKLYIVALGFDQADLIRDPWSVCPGMCRFATGYE